MDIVSARKRIDRWFPELAGFGYEPTSEVSTNYNCIAWAAREDHRRWDPNFGFHWPQNIPRDDRVETLIRVFESLGFILLDKIDSLAMALEPALDKVALYALEDSWTHAARQLPTEKWTSKLGDLDDIQHETLDGFSAVYGAVRHVMRR